MLKFREAVGIFCRRLHFGSNMGAWAISGLKIINQLHSTNSTSAKSQHLLDIRHRQRWIQTFRACAAAIQNGGRCAVALSPDEPIRANTSHSCGASTSSSNPQLSTRPQRRNRLDKDDSRIITSLGSPERAVMCEAGRSRPNKRLQLAAHGMIECGASFLVPK